MDEYVKNSIDSRKNALFATYDVKDAEILKKIDALFIEIDKLGKESKDAMDFEAKFAASPLNQQYLDLFTEVATKCSPKVAAPSADAAAATAAAEQQFKEGLIQGTAEGLANDAIHRVVPTRAAVHQKAYDAARDIPGVGEALSIKQHADFFGRFRKKNDN
jgi:hypothetical protein